MRATKKQKEKRREEKRLGNKIINPQSTRRRGTQPWSRENTRNRKEEKKRETGTHTRRATAGRDCETRVVGSDSPKRVRRESKSNWTFSIVRVLSFFFYRPFSVLFLLYNDDEVFLVFPYYFFLPLPLIYHTNLI